MSPPQVREAGRTPAPSAPAKISRRTLALFRLYLAWFVPRHFHALRIRHAERFPQHAHPLIVCINHASWWDPLIILTLQPHLAPGRFAHAPMEADALAHYGFFRKLGAFPVDNRSTRSAAQFLRQASSILTSLQSILWMTPEGRFTDARQRPVVWKPGTAALTRHLGACTVVPVAIEYTFWDERLPEVLCSIGEPISFSSDSTATTEARTQLLQSAMTFTQNDLAACAIQRDPSLFTSIFARETGVSPIYNLWQRMKSALSGKPYLAEHSTIVRTIARIVVRK